MAVKLVDTKDLRVVDFDEALRDQFRPDPYLYETDFDRLEHVVRKQSEFLAKLTESLANSGRISAEDLDELLGYRFNIEGVK